MSLVGAALDGLLTIALLWLAWQVLHGANLFRAVVSFMVFGLLMAVVWVRLQAPDIALAEAAIGAGVTGALLLSALGRLPERQTMLGSDIEPVPAVTGRRRSALPWLSLGAGLVALLAYAAWQLPAPGLGEEVRDALARTGVENPVTAVLLDFRAFDTLLEIGVLLLAVAVVWSFGRAPAPGSVAAVSPVLPALSRLLLPVFVLVGVYLLWRGGHAPGGAFPAGAVLGAGGVLMMLAGSPFWRHRGRELPLRGLLLIGLVVFLLAGLFGLLFGRGFLDYPPQWAQHAIILIELSTAASIAAMLTALYLGGEPPHLRRVREEP